MTENEKLSEVVARMDPATVTEFAGIDPGPMRKESTELVLVEETGGILWSVRTNGTVFLVVRNQINAYDVQAVSDGGVEYLGDVETHNAALALIEAEIAE